MIFYFRIVSEEVLSIPFPFQTYFQNLFSQQLELHHSLEQPSRLRQEQFGEVHS